MTAHGWFFWFLVVLFCARAAYAVLSIGDEREPIKKDQALFYAVVNLALAILLFYEWGK